MDKHDQTCIASTFKVIGSKWTVFILRELFDGTKRFKELERSLEGISPRTLSARLSQLEKDGILKKNIYPVIPPKVEYSLTEKGKSLKDVIGKIREWGDSTSPR